jgi:hypothetical protein
MKINQISWLTGHNAIAVQSSTAEAQMRGKSVGNGAEKRDEGEVQEQMDRRRTHLIKRKQLGLPPSLMGADCLRFASLVLPRCRRAAWPSILGAVARSSSLGGASSSRGSAVEFPQAERAGGGVEFRRRSSSCQGAFPFHDLGRRTTGNRIFAECHMLCRAPNIGLSAKNPLPRACTRQRLAPGKDKLCRELDSR